MMRTLKFGMLLLLAGCAGTPWGTGAPPEPAGKADVNPVGASDKSVVRGEALYRDLGCVGCHGRDGAGDGGAASEVDPRPRAFSDPAWQADRSDGEIRHAILTGFPGTAMVPQEPLFVDPDDVWHVVNFIRSLGP